ncbi:MAG: serine/threonine-protein kinase [bacterium]
MADPTVRFRLATDAAASRDGSGFGLPADLLRQSRHRVRIIALLMLIASGADLVMMTVGAFYTHFRWSEVLGPDAIPALGTLFSFSAAAILFLAAGTDRIRNGTLLTIALAFEVFVCFVLSVSNPIAVYGSTGRLPNLTWVTPLIILFPLIVPCPPRRTLVTALLAAATRPIALVLLVAAGLVRADSEAYFTAVFSPGLAVVFATFGSRVVYGLGMEVARARQMGNYTLERKLGSGGMGEVWLARHRLLARPAAVKLVRSDHLTREPAGESASVILERFEREAQATAALRSPHTINLFDYGVSDEGTFYYVMELLDGLDADSLVRRFGPVPAGRAIGILRQMCHSLAEAHERGLTHRDIKPANVYVCRYGRDHDFVKVLDFGLVKTATDASSATALTMEGVISGTPAFMAPEQARGADRADARSDLYAVGCVAYWLLTGRLVFDGTGAVDLLVHHARSEPVPPSQRTELEIPTALDEIVLACLAKDPARRPPTAADLSARLASCGVAEWSPDEARDWWSAHLPGSTAD